MQRASSVIALAAASRQKARDPASGGESERERSVLVHAYCTALDHHSEAALHEQLHLYTARYELTYLMSSSSSNSSSSTAAWKS
eukprot:6033-Heterococcus_DN1.PRE.1